MGYEFSMTYQGVATRCVHDDTTGKWQVLVTEPVGEVLLLADPKTADEAMNAAFCHINERLHQHGS